MIVRHAYNMGSNPIQLAKLPPLVDLSNGKFPSYLTMWAPVFLYGSVPSKSASPTRIKYGSVYISIYGRISVSVYPYIGYSIEIRVPFPQKVKIDPYKNTGGKYRTV